MLTPQNKRTLLDYWLEDPGKGCIECCDEIWDVCESGQTDSREISDFFTTTAQKIKEGSGFLLWNCEMTVRWDNELVTAPVLVVATSPTAIIEQGPAIVQSRYSEEIPEVSFSNIQQGAGNNVGPFAPRIELVVPYN